MAKTRINKESKEGLKELLGILLKTAEDYCVDNKIEVESSQAILNALKKLLYSNEITGAEQKQKTSEDSQSILHLPETDEYGNTPLHVACKQGDLKVVSKLLISNAEINATNRFGFTPLIDAITKKQSDIVERLLKEDNIDVNICDENGYTALHYAAMNNELETIELLVNKGANLAKLTKSNGSNVMHCAAIGVTEVSEDWSLVEWLVQNKNLPVDLLNAEDKFGTTVVETFESKDWSYAAHYSELIGIPFN